MRVNLGEARLKGRSCRRFPSVPPARLPIALMIPWVDIALLVGKDFVGSGWFSLSPDRSGLRHEPVGWDGAIGAAHRVFHRFAKKSSSHRFAIIIPFRLNVAKIRIIPCLTKFKPQPADGVGTMQKYIRIILKYSGIFGEMDNFQGNQPG